MVWQVGQLEFILDCLVDEKDRSTQKSRDGENTLATDVTGGGAGPLHASANAASDGSSQLSLEISVSRPAEIDAALQQFVSPKVNHLRHHTSWLQQPRRVTFRGHLIFSIHSPSFFSERLDAQKS